MAKTITKTQIAAQAPAVTSEDDFLSDKAAPKAELTMVTNGDGKRILHLQVALDLDSLRLKPNGKSAYQYVSAWCDGVQGVRLGGNVFVNVNRLSAKVLAKARANFDAAERGDDKPRVVADIDKLG